MRRVVASRSIFDLFVLSLDDICVKCITVYMYIERVALMHVYRYVYEFIYIYMYVCTLHGIGTIAHDLPNTTLVVHTVHVLCVYIVQCKYSYDVAYIHGSSRLPPSTIPMCMYMCMYLYEYKVRCTRYHVLCTCTSTE